MNILGLVDIPTWLLLILFLLPLLYYYLTSTHGTFKELGIRGPKPYPVLGTLLPSLRKGFLTVVKSYYKDYGKEKAFGTYVGSKPNLIILDPEMIRQIFVKETNIFTNRQRFVMDQEPMNLMVSVLEDERWKRVRNLMTPTFSAGKLKMMNKQINLCARHLVENLGKHADDGTPADVKEYDGAFTMDVIASTAFGLQIDSQKDLNNTFIVMAKKVFNFSFFNPVVFILLFMPSLLPLVKRMKFSFFPQDVRDFFLDIVNRTLDQRKEGEQTQVDFVQLMLNAHKELAEHDQDHKEEGTENADQEVVKGLTRNEVLAQCVLFFIAGYETTANAISYALYSLALNPECQEKLHEEIMREIGDKETVDYNSLSQMSYLEMCINESLRIYPPALATDRVCKSDITIEGVPIKKEMLCVLSIYMLHHHPDVWPDPDKFDPERFTAEAKAQRSPYYFAPFGLGARNCIAMRLALMEVKLSLIHIIRAFKVMTCEQTMIPLKFKNSGFLQTEGGIFLKMERRG